MHELVKDYYGKQLAGTADLKVLELEADVRVAWAEVEPHERRAEDRPRDALARGGIAGEVRGEDLDGDIAIELDVAREVNDAHAAAAELALERVLAGEGGLEFEEVVGGVWHLAWNNGGRSFALPS